jgi:hypothetical protein
MTEQPLRDTAPTDASLTDYDWEQRITYLRLLDAAADNADWREVCRLVLNLDPEAEPDRARRCHDSHLARARWISATGYRDWLKPG